MEFLMASLVALYVLLVFFTPPTWIALILCALMGVNVSAIGFNVMHDGAHGKNELPRSKHSAISNR